MGTVIIAVIMMLLSAGVNIIPKMVGGGELISGESPETQIDLHSLSIADGAGILTDEDIASLGGMGFPAAERCDDIQAMIDELSTADPGAALVTTSAAETDGEITGYTVRTYYSPDTDGDSVDAVSGTVITLMKFRTMVDLGVSPEDFAATQRYYSALKIQAGSDEWSVFESAINYVVPIVLSLVLFIFIFVYGQTVAQAIDRKSVV